MFRHRGAVCVPPIEPALTKSLTFSTIALRVLIVKNGKNVPLLRAGMVLTKSKHSRVGRRRMDSVGCAIFAYFSCAKLSLRRGKRSENSSIACRPFALRDRPFLRGRFYFDIRSLFRVSGYERRYFW